MELRDMDPFIRYMSTGRNVFAKSKEATPADLLFSPDYRIMWVYSSNGRINISGVEYHLTHDSIVFIPPKRYFFWCPDAGTSSVYFTINFDCTKDYANLTKRFPPFPMKQDPAVVPYASVDFTDVPELNEPFVLTDAKAVVPSFNNLARERFYRDTQSDNLKAFLLKAVLCEAIREIRRRNHVTPGKTNEIINRIKQFVQEKYASEISYETIAKEFNMHPVYLNRIFKKEERVSLHTYIVGVRIEKAKSKLTYYTTPIRTVAEECGFPDYPNFTRAFHRIVGITPKEFRRSAQEKST